MPMEAACKCLEREKLDNANQKNLNEIRRNERDVGYRPRDSTNGRSSGGPRGQVTARLGDACEHVELDRKSFKLSRAWQLTTRDLHESGRVKGKKSQKSPKKGFADRIPPRPLAFFRISFWAKRKNAWRETAISRRGHGHQSSNFGGHSEAAIALKHPPPSPVKPLEWL